jgi:HAD superfamily hydrolase (TIGR01509 family)
VLGLPEQTAACLFDLDGVVTRTAVVHAAAWKATFDDFLRARAAQPGEAGQPGQSGQRGETGGPAREFVPFDPVDDYDRYVDGKPRLDGTRAFLRARGIELPEGSPQDPGDALTLWGLSNRKNAMVLQKLAEDGVEAYPGSVRYIRGVRRAGLRTAVVSSSANTAQVLTAAGIAADFDVRIDSLAADQRGLAGKPAPDTYLAAAADLGVGPKRAAVFEDALAGVTAGRAGGFGLVVGVDRTGQADALRRSGADVVVQDLAELLGHGQ